MIALPASNAEVLAQAINPALEWLPPPMRSDQARCMLLAIGRQESGFAARHQFSGPAHGFWQFERNGVLAVMHNNRSADGVYRLCKDLGVLYGSNSIYDALLADDEFAAGIARLMLWADPRSLPKIGDVQGAWDVYERCWRPGKPDYTRWKGAYGQAVETMEAAA